MSTKRMVNAFYGVVLITALVGSTAAAAKWLHTEWWIAAGPVAAVELGGVVLSMFATDRRKLGESAIVTRVLSALVALTAAAANFFGHSHIGQAAFFGTMSTLGYAVYLLISAAKRRDALRAAGKLEDTAPSYGAWQWLRHPGLTRRARILAITGKLGRLASLAAAREQVRAERREAGLARAVRELVAAGAGKDMAAIAVDTYDMNEIARRLADGADYDGLTGLLAGRLTADKLAGTEPEKAPLPDDITAVADAVSTGVEQAADAAAGDTVSLDRAAVRATRARHPRLARPRRMARSAPQITIVLPDPKPARTPPAQTAKRETSAPSRGRPSKAQKVASFAAKMPGAPTAEIARKAGVSADTVRRHLAASAPINGHNLDGGESS